jgi:hypothetical protein
MNFPDLLRRDPGNAILRNGVLQKRQSGDWRSREFARSSRGDFGIQFLAGRDSQEWLSY